ncbi:MAG: methyltransferase type 11 [Alphaproteobacteria bacterium]|nr:methyltransferase type 11 [Alphaproteobacteria bacterium]|tara:strand:- start:1880 stop:2539 length:660 start_codon:yes stop_codon:yes gene_type:complete
MGRSINLLRNYPKSKRNLDKRLEEKNHTVRAIARKFGKDFFDGDRKYGYGGFNYHKRFWNKVVKDFKKYWKLDRNSSVLDIGCGKGFMLYDLKKEIPGIKFNGVDISRYAIKNSKKEVKKFLKVADAKKLPFPDKSFDIVIAINTIHNLNKKDCAKSIKEINRVCKRKSFITVDAYRNKSEKEKMFKWNLTAKTIMSVKQWKVFFKKNSYKGDYYWFIP